MRQQAMGLVREAWSDVMRDRVRGFLFYFTNLRFLYMSQLAPLISAAIVDSAAKGTIGDTWLKLALLLALGEILSSILGYVQRRVQNDLVETLSAIRYARYAGQAFAIDYHALVHASRGALVSKTRSKADFINPFLNLSNDAIRITVSIVVSFFVLLDRYPPLAWAYLGVWIPLCTVFYKVATSRVHINKMANDAWDSYFGDFSDTVGNIDTVKHFATEEFESKRLLKVGARQFGIYAKRWRAAARQQNVFSIFDTILNVSFGLFGLYALARGRISIGTFVLVAAYIRNTVNDANGVSNFIRTFNEETVRGSSLDEYRQEPRAKKTHRGVTDAVGIRLKDATFSYADGKQDVLKDFDLEIQKGERVGIVGRSGSGKTTITKLLLGLYPLEKGEIYFGSESASTLGTRAVRRLIAYVPQEPALFHRSIRDNIMYGNPNATDEAVDRAVRLAYVHEFSDHLPEGLDTLVGDRGVKLSGGQRQRVAIARAILKDSPILLLDEATSALDSESEAFIQKAMSNIMKGRTAIVVAHRLSTLRSMDRIIVMDDGKVAEDGSHEALLKNKGLYANLWRHQTGGFIEE